MTNFIIYPNDKCFNETNSKTVFFMMISDTPVSDVIKICDRHVSGTCPSNNLQKFLHICIPI